MVYEFKLPDVGEGLTEGEIVKWYVKEGDAIEADQHMVDVLTDKATVEISSPKAGHVLAILAHEGARIKIGEVIVAIGQQGEVYAGPKAHLSSLGHDSREASLGASVSVSRSPIQTEEVLATPAVRKLAKELNVDLAFVRGTGPQGRIMEQDIRQLTQGNGQAPLAPPPSYGPEERIPFRGIRRRTAEKMVKSVRTTAQVTHMDEADVTALVVLRGQLKEEAEKKGIKLTYLSYVLRAVAKTLNKFPYFNASLDEAKEEIVLKKYINIGIAIASEQGLTTPVVEGCDKKNVLELAQEIEALSKKAREGKLESRDFQGGTFTITSVGSVGGLLATPIINHPETAILGVFKIVKKPVVKEGQIVIRDMMNLALSFDHRVQDGVHAAEFMNAVIQELEHPKDL